MKIGTTILVALMVTLLITSTASFALAQEVGVDSRAEASSSLSIDGDAGITPESGLYGVKLSWEKFKLAFTADQEVKAHKELKLASKRLVEAREMVDRGNAEGFVRAQAQHELMLQRAQTRLESIDRDGSADNIRAWARIVVGLETAVEVHEYKIAALRERLDDANLTAEQRARIEASISKMESKTEALKTKLEEREERIKTRLRAVTEKSESEIEAEIDEIKAEVNMTATLQTIAKARIDAAERALIKLKDRESSGRLEVGQEVINARIDSTTAAIARARTSYEAELYAQAIVQIKPFGNFGKSMSDINEERKEIRENLKEDMREIERRVMDELKEARSKTKESRSSVGAEASASASADARTGTNSQTGTSAEAESSTSVDVNLDLGA